jgi:hypothetical protein
MFPFPSLFFGETSHGTFTRWEDFKPIRKELPNAGLLTRVLTLLFCLVGGAVLGFLLAMFIWWAMRRGTSGWAVKV